MNYERIILELMERIQILEEKVAVLESGAPKTSDNSAESESGEKLSLTARARACILAEKEKAQREGRTEIVLLCNDIQKQMGVVNRAPAVCAAMYECMGKNDVVLYAPSSGKSTAVKIKYYIQ